MTEVSFEEMKEETHQYLLENDESVCQEELVQQLGMSHREMGDVLISLYHDDKANMLAGREWVAESQNNMTLRFKNGKMRIDYE